MGKDLPPEILEKLTPAMEALREEIREAVIFSPYPGGGQRIDRAALAVARANDGGALNYQQGLTRIMDNVVGRETLKKMREARRQYKREHDRMMVELDDDSPTYVDRDPDLIEQRARGY